MTIENKVFTRDAAAEAREAADQIVLQALEVAAEQFHELAADHWSYSCEELAPCKYCKARAVIKGEKCDS